eukprot:s1767_g2.t1
MSAVGCPDGSKVPTKWASVLLVMSILKAVLQDVREPHLAVAQARVKCIAADCKEILLRRGHGADRRMHHRQLRAAGGDF